MSNDRISSNRGGRSNRRKRVERMKKIILTTLAACILIPVVICLILSRKVGKLENEIDFIKEVKNGQSVELIKQLSKPASMTILKGMEQNAAILKEAKREEASEAYEGKKRVYLTFDDGPSENTDKILDILKKNDVKATFFVIGREDEVSKARYKRIVKEGHVLAMHSYSHDYAYIYKSKENFAKDYKRIHDLLYDVTGVKPTIYRFPGGSSNQLNVRKQPMSVFIKYLSSQGVDYYDWNAMNGDAEGALFPENKLISTAMSTIDQCKVPIVLMHDAPAKTTTVTSLSDVIKKLKALDYEILPIDDSAPLIQHIKVGSVK